MFANKEVVKVDIMRDIMRDVKANIKAGIGGVIEADEPHTFVRVVTA